MGIALRRVTYSFFLLLFFIVTPLLILYASGFRYNFDIGMIEKTGAFYIKSYPRNAEIYINDLKSKHKTPKQITNLAPGTYTLKITKNNYTPWQKKLSVYSGETTFVEDVVLFLENQEKTELGSGSVEFLINKNKDKYAYLDEQNRLFITDVNQDKNFLIFTLGQAYNLVDWSLDNQFLLIKKEELYYTFDLNQKEIQWLPLSAIEKIIWDNKESNIIWYTKDEKIFRYNTQIVNHQPQPIDFDSEKTINDFALFNDYLIIQYTNNKNNYVEQLNKNNLSPVQTISDVNLGKLDVLMADERHLLFTIGSTLYIQNIYQEPVLIPITKADLHDNNLLLTNGYEIVLYNYKESQQQLIDRSSQIVSDILWHPNGSYFISEVNEKTKITEVDGRDQRNSVELLDDPWKKMYLFNKKGDKLFILTPEENFYLTIK